MRIVSMFLLLFLMNSNVTAQVPGYMGHKIELGYSFGGALLLTELGGTRMPSNHTIDFGYTIKRKVQVGIDARFKTQEVQLQEFLYSDQFLGGSSQLPEFKYFSIGPKIRIYTGDFMSPLGKYHQFGLGRTSIKFNGVPDPEMSLSLYSETDPVDPHIYIMNEGHKHWYIDYRYGISRILFGSVFLTTEAGLRWTFGGDTFNPDGLERLSNNFFGTDYFSMNVEGEASRNIRMSNLYSLRIGLGVYL